MGWKADGCGCQSASQTSFFPFPYPPFLVRRLLWAKGVTLVLIGLGVPV